LALVFLLLPDQLDQTDLVELLLASVKLLIFALVMAVTGLLFFAGYGNMLSRAAAGEKASAASFVEGLKKYILKLLLAGLLLTAIVVVYSMALSVLLVPVIFILSMGSGGDTAAISSTIGTVSSLFTGLPTVFLMPFIILWFPAIFSDSLKTVESLKRGAKTGTKCYGTLLLWTVVTYLPTLVYLLFNMSQVQNGTLYTPGYIIVTVISVVLSFLYLCATFILYRERYQPGPYYYPRRNGGSPL
jgi:hypothetical protein